MKIDQDREQKCALDPLGAEQKHRRKKKKHRRKKKKHRRKSLRTTAEIRKIYRDSKIREKKFEFLS